MGEADAWLLAGQDERVTDPDHPRALGTSTPYGDVAAEFDDHAARRGDIVGHEVGDQRLRARYEVELALGVAFDRVVLSVEVDGGESQWEHRSRSVQVGGGGQVVVVAVVTEGEQRLQDGRVA